ncbi:MAG: hypothetical protein WC866_04825 [Patescibacteria group bacterium]|jgi:hypothetical protein
MSKIEEELQAARARRDASTQEAASEMQALTARIKAGETTGDTIRDYLIANWPDTAASPEGAKIEEAYRSLVARTAGKKGQFVLLIEREKIHAGGCEVQWAPMRESFAFGRLEGDALRLSLHMAGWAFPTTQFSRYGDVHNLRTFYKDPEIHSEQGSLRPWCEIAFFKLQSEQVDLNGCENPGFAYFNLGVDYNSPIMKLVILIGNDEIDAWCRRIRADGDLIKVIQTTKYRVDTARVDMIRQLAKAIGADPEGILAVKQLNDLERAETLEKLQTEVERLRVANEGFKEAKTPADGALHGGTVVTARENILKLLDKAESLGINDPFIQRLRAAHPAK